MKKQIETKGFLVEPASATRHLYCISQLAQLRLHLVSMIALYDDTAVLDRSPRPAGAFEMGGGSFEAVVCGGQAGYHGYLLAFTALYLSSDSNDAILRICCSIGFLAFVYALFRFGSLFGDPARFGAVYQT